MVTPAEDQGQYMSDEGAWYGKVSGILRLGKIFLFLAFRHHILTG